MKRLVIVPVADIQYFQGFQEVCRDHSLAGLVGDTQSGRSREQFSSQEMFLEAVARGDADLYSFQSIEEATAFASKKLESLNRLGTAIENRVKKWAPQEFAPFSDYEILRRR